MSVGKKEQRGNFPIFGSKAFFFQMHDVLFSRAHYVILLIYKDSC